MSLYQSLAEIEARGDSAVVCTIIESSGSTPRHQDSRMIVYPDGQFTGSVGGGEVESRVLAEAKIVFTDGHSRVFHYDLVDPGRGDPGICGGSVTVYLEPILPKPCVVVIGGGHVGKAVAHLAKWLGFRVVVSDDRPELCTPEANPDADEFYPIPMEDLPKHLQINSQTYLVLTTRGMNVDVPGVPALLDTAAGYIGIIGSRRRWVMSKKGMIEAGVTQEKIESIHSPIGLEIGAETPEEIAVSIMAEIIMIRNGGSGKSMKIN
ncbi:MAG: XdhC family protein [Anaerolineaceae bacterium]